MTVELRCDNLLSGLLAVLLAAGTDKEHQKTYQVQFWHRADRFYLSATNSSWAAVWCFVDGCQWNSQRMAISRPDAEFLAGVLKLDGSVQPLTIEANGSDLEVSCDGWRVTRRLAAEIGPDIEGLVTSTEPGKVDRIGMDAALVNDIRKAFRLAGGLDADDSALQFCFGEDDSKPVLVLHSNCSDLSVVLMPVACGAALQCQAEIDDDGNMRLVRKDTGEVVSEEPPPKQVQVPGTEDNVIAFRTVAQKIAADLGAKVSVDFGDQSFDVPKPEKKRRGGKKEAPANETGVGHE